MLSNGVGDTKGSLDVVSSKNMSDAFRGSLNVGDADRC